MTSQEQRNANTEGHTLEGLLRERAEKVRQFATLLQVRRLEVRGDPFRGFDSSPGRF
jgi:hypothetical protein